MGQIIGSAAKPKRCNLNKLSQLGILAAGEYILVSSDNSMNAAGQGNFDCYVEGDGRTAAAALKLKSVFDELFISENQNLFDIENLDIMSEGANITHSVSGGELSIVNSGTNNQGLYLYLPDTEPSKQYTFKVNATNVRQIVLYKGSSTNYEVLTADGTEYSTEYNGSAGYWFSIIIGSNRTCVVSSVTLEKKNSEQYIKPELIRNITEESLSEELQETIHNSIKSETNVSPVLFNSRCVGVPSGVKVTYNDDGSVDIENTTASNAGLYFFAYAKRGVEFAISIDCVISKLFKIAVFDYYVQTQYLAVQDIASSGKYTTPTFTNPASGFRDSVVLSLTLRGNATYHFSSFGLIIPSVENQVPEGAIIQLSKKKLARRYDIPCPVLVYQKNGENIDIFTNGLFDSDTKDGEFALNFTNNDHFALSDETDVNTPRVNGYASRFRLLASADIGAERCTIYDAMGQAGTIVLQVKDTGTPVNPSEEKYILMIGDSLTARRVLPTEFRRYLNNAGLTNWKMVGRVQIETDITGVNYEAQGGYAWPNYVDDPDTLPAGHPNNYFWNPNTDSLDIKYYFDTYCGGVSPSIIVCNVGWNQFVNTAYATMSMSEMKAKVRTFLNAVHSDFPNCKVLLDGIQRGMPNATIYVHKMYLEDQVKLAKAYQEICEESDYAGWVMYGNIAPYFDGRFGIKTGQRSTSMFNNEMETYIVDEVHPNDLGYKMFAYAAFLHFLYMANH